MKNLILPFIFVLTAQIAFANEQVIAQSESGDNLIVASFESGEVVSVRVCDQAGECEFLGESQYYRMDLLEDQHSDELLKAIGSGGAALITAAGTGFAAIMYLGMSGASAVLIPLVKMGIPATGALYGTSAAAAVAVPTGIAAAVDAVNPLHHLEIAKSLELIIDQSSTQRLSDEDFEDLLEALAEGLDDANAQTDAPQDLMPESTANPLH
jgi:hypothetical protein